MVDTDHIKQQQQRTMAMPDNGNIDGSNLLTKHRKWPLLITRNNYWIVVKEEGFVGVLCFLEIDQ